MSNTKRLIVTETHRAVPENLKGALGLRCLSCTFLPDFPRGVNVSIQSVCRDTSIRISNPSVVRCDGIGSYELQKDITRRYDKNLVTLLLDIHDGESEILLAQDNDFGGNLMASLLYHHLLCAGVPKRLLKRVVGIEEVTRNGRPYADIYFGGFIENDLLQRIIERSRIERSIIYTTRGISKHLAKGIRNITALNMAVRHSMYDEYLKRKSEGVSLATYLTKGCLDER